MGKLPGVGEDDAWFRAETDHILELGLAKDLLVLHDIVEGVHRELGFSPEPGRGTLQGTLVPYLLGITSDNPVEKPSRLFIDHEKIELPLQVQIYYDNEIRNRVVDWVKVHYEGMSTRLGQPILKLPKMVIMFKRLLKEA